MDEHRPYTDKRYAGAASFPLAPFSLMAKPLSALLALTAGATASWLATPLVLAQARPGVEESVEERSVPPPEPLARPEVRIQAPGTPSTSIAVPALSHLHRGADHPAHPPGTGPAAGASPPIPGEASAATRRPGSAERPPEPVRRFDASLDALVREGVVTPGSGFGCGAPC